VDGSIPNVGDVPNRFERLQELMDEVASLYISSSEVIPISRTILATHADAVQGSTCAWILVASEASMMADALNSREPTFSRQLSTLTKSGVLETESSRTRVTRLAYADRSAVTRRGIRRGMRVNACECDT